MPRTQTANRITQDGHIATVTSRGLRYTYTCDCGQTFSGGDALAEARWGEHVAAERTTAAAARAAQTPVYPRGSGRKRVVS